MTDNLYSSLVVSIDVGSGQGKYNHFTLSIRHLKFLSVLTVIILLQYSESLKRLAHDVQTCNTSQDVLLPVNPIIHL